MNSALQDKTVGALSQILGKGIGTHAERGIGCVNFRATGNEAGHVLSKSFICAKTRLENKGAKAPITVMIAVGKSGIAYLLSLSRTYLMN